MSEKRCAERWDGTSEAVPGSEGSTNIGAAAGAAPALSCRYCKTGRLKRSRRRGLHEGLLLRLAFRAPFRCHSCGRRYSVFAPPPEFRRRQPYPDLATYLGLRGNERKIQQWAITSGMIALVMLIALIFALGLARS